MASQVRSASESRKAARVGAPSDSRTWIPPGRSSRGK
jgi:hypothetical protein